MEVEMEVEEEEEDEEEEDEDSSKSRQQASFGDFRSPTYEARNGLKRTSLVITRSLTSSLHPKLELSQTSYTDRVVISND